MYKCLIDWRDLSDGHLYRAGDTFPFDGREISPERIESLVSGDNQAGMVLIMAFGEPNEAKPVQETKQPRVGKKRQKTPTK